ncbi:MULTISPECIES: symmetrical bis(5'-nucleosyl)-tetraphosphatase [Halomonas]|uniref:bis(5'-nucleosyl)-tetraphosphatase (symmetrical) n=1 Tax=Halomonas chromatireducens TaxID=507626 RepID=A0A120JW54_9GAMM|nr:MULTISPECIES: symmetrical bis(5'-nucleosyl)-tetraphosphatase [Halomonas]AMD01251.1 Bis(5'-nucleosyl)-tetraphosphatase, symmetrical [Halomonas chromatireducens]MBZ0329958.1 symmetrical bis(5'-nucleosyl)-tetraphosphatase [Halomonas sp. ANAO-440]
MTTYAIGDLQGCHAEFVELLERLAFDPRHDRLWLAGDLVNRGPGSLDCLREVRALGEAAVTVLGNHDLHLLAVARGGASLNRKDTLESILEAPDREALLDWLQSRPLLVRQAVAGQGDTVMSHAGVLPQWSPALAEVLAGEVVGELRSERSGAFLEQMYGNEPACWHDSLEGVDRLRAIVNVLTRMRFIDAEGCLDFSAKEGLDSAPAGFAPWFCYPRQDEARLVFGHWAALEGKAPGARARVEALDTGCVWGGRLTALNLSTGERTGVPSHQRR